MTQADQQKPWTLSLRAKARNLDFKLKISRILALCKLPRFSIRFRLRHYVFKVESKPKSSFSFKPRSLKPKFLQILKNFHSKRSKNEGIVRNWCDHKNYMYGERKIRIWLWAVVASFVIIIMQLSYYLGQRLVCKLSRWAWIYAASSGLFNQFSKVIFNGICRSMGL